MPIYNYKERFVPYLKNGSKFHTIRSIRKYPAKPGDTLYHYTGLRTRYSYKIMEPTTCTAVYTIMIQQDGDVWLFPRIMTYAEQQTFDNDDAKEWYMIKRTLSTEQKILLAWHDGFRIEHQDEGESDPDNFSMMLRFWRLTHPLPFVGHLICWHPQPAKVSYLK